MVARNTTSRWASCSSWIFNIQRHESQLTNSVGCVHLFTSSDLTFWTLLVAACRNRSRFEVCKRLDLRYENRNRIHRCCLLLPTGAATCCARSNNDRKCSSVGYNRIDWHTRPQPKWQCTGAKLDAREKLCVWQMIFSKPYNTQTSCDWN
jgi:hypothetical protein